MGISDFDFDFLTLSQLNCVYICTVIYKAFQTKETEVGMIKSPVPCEMNDDDMIELKVSS